jgi:putative tryptophan/tyrosine transport system substrate-binding protein
MSHMRRREFIALLGGAAAWPLAAGAQQAERPMRIGFLRPSPAPERALAAFRSGLAENGLVAGRNYDLVTRWGGGSAEPLEALAAELVKSEVNLIVVDGLISARAVRAVTSTIPIVMAFGADPVRGGVAQSLARPGGNVSGVTSQSDVVSGKTFEILREIVPQLSRLAVVDSALGLELFRPGDAQAARTLGIAVSYVDLGAPDQFNTALQNVLAAGAQGAVIRGTPWVSDAQRRLITERVIAHRLPAIHQDREFVEVGGLMSYGADRNELYRRAAAFVGKILKGAKPADLPFELPTKFEMVVNLKPARVLGLTVPTSILLRADEVIE